MSQTETIMLFVLGSSVTLLLVLFFGRGLWSLIGHWSGWRAERKVPSIIRDLEAERDSLRAEKAMMAKRLETSTGDIKMRMAEQMAEVARNRNRVLDLTANLESAQAQIIKLQEENTLKADQINALKVQIEENVGAINSAWQRASEHEKHVDIAKTAADTLRNEITQRDHRITNLENEAKAMREIVAMFVPSEDDVRQAKAIRAKPKAPAFADEYVNPFQEAPMPLTASGTTIVPPFKPIDAAAKGSMEIDEPVNDIPASALRAGQEAVARSASNVLSLADRFRGLQSGMKRR